MKKIIVLICILALNSMFAAADEKSEKERKPVAILGNYTKTLINKIMIANDIEYKKFKEWLPASEYKNYSVIIFSDGLRSNSRVNYEAAPEKWINPQAFQQIMEYLKSGGQIIVTGACFSSLAGKGRNLKDIEQILGFAYYLSCKEHAGVKTATATFPFDGLSKEKTYHWQSNVSVSKLSSAQILASYVSKDGEPLCPFATVNKVGKGRVYWFALPIVRLFISIRDSLGEADEKGEYIQSEQEKDAEIYCNVMAKAILEANPARNETKKEKWNPLPLGAKGALTYPVAKPPASEAPAIKKDVKVSDILLADNGKAEAAIIVFGGNSNGSKRCAEILKSHLDEMTGANFKIMKAEQATADAAPGASRIIIGTYNEIKNELEKSNISVESGQPEDIFLKTAGNKLFISGSDKSGLKFALYSFLESLGCRYLWPGDTGKVIPRKKTLYSPELDIKEHPKVAMRNIRMSTPGTGRTASALSKIALESKSFIRDYKSSLKTSQNDDGWAAWHKLGTREYFARGHSFGDYYKNYGKKHPYWFALQGNGKRSQFLSESRPRLCQSNKELIEQIGKNIIAEFDASPTKKSASICLNDGGYTSFCMCEECRKLDPVNAPPIIIGDYSKGLWRRFPYVSLTDRVIWFSNKIAEKVSERYPDKKLSIYAYSLYASPPVSVKPHSNLLIFYTGMSYADENARQKALKEWRDWASFGNKMFFRPNCLLANRRKIMPQNFSRKIFNDFKAIYNQNLAGTDFDSCTSNWALDGLNSYMLAKAHWNPNKLDYDELLEDYCKAGFGDGWKYLREYFLELEKLSNKAAEKKLPIFDLYSKEVFNKLNGFLLKAEEAAKKAGQTKELERVAFIKLGLDFASIQKKFYDVMTDKEASPDKKNEVKIAYKNFLKNILKNNKLAVNLPMVLFYNKYLKSEK